MNKKDILWQKLLDAEKSRLTSLAPEELMAMGNFTSCRILHGEMAIDYGFWHETPDYRPGTNIHSFVLQAKRKLFLGTHKNYLAGFSIDTNGKIIPIADEVLSSYD